MSCHCWKNWWIPNYQPNLIYHQMIQSRFFFVAFFQWDFFVSLVSGVFTIVFSRLYYHKWWMVNSMTVKAIYTNATQTKGNLDVVYFMLFLVNVFLLLLSPMLCACLSISILLYIPLYYVQYKNLRIRILFYRISLCTSLSQLSFLLSAKLLYFELLF